MIHTTARVRHAHTNVSTPQVTIAAACASKTTERGRKTTERSSRVGESAGPDDVLSADLGWVVSASVIVHELPQEISDFTVLVQAGLPVSHALIANFSSSLSSLIGEFFCFSCKYILVGFLRAPLASLLIAFFLSRAPLIFFRLTSLLCFLCFSLLVHCVSTLPSLVFRFVLPWNISKQKSFIFGTHSFLSQKIVPSTGNAV